MNDNSEGIDWNLTTWEGSRREQIRRWSKLTMDEILAAQEEMATLAVDLHAAAKIRKEPYPKSTPNANDYNKLRRQGYSNAMIERLKDL
jgi:hypothetical protein